MTTTEVMVEAGSNWLHRESLLPVRVHRVDTRYWEPGNVPFQVSAFFNGTKGLWIQTVAYDQFLNEFEPDVPLTREWLIENGIGVSYDGHGSEVYDFDDDGDLCAYWLDGQWYWEFHGAAVWKGKEKHAQTTGAAMRLLKTLDY
jgi:hypothetical protein